MSIVDKLNRLTNAHDDIRDALYEKGVDEAYSHGFEDFSTDISNISGCDHFKFGGRNAVKIAQHYRKWTLEDTSFVIGTSANTTATTIRASKTDYTTDGTDTLSTKTGSPTLTIKDNDIVVVQRCLVTPIHSEEATGARVINTVYEMVTHLSKRKTTDTSLNTTRQAVNQTLVMIKYYNASNTITRANTSYGFYMTPAAPSCASATSDSTYVRCPTPTLYYRASSTYESTTNIKLVTDCTYEWFVEVYLVEEASTIGREIINDLEDVLLNGINVPEFTAISALSDGDELSDEE